MMFVIYRFLSLWNEAILPLCSCILNVLFIVQQLRIDAPPFFYSVFSFVTSVVTEWIRALLSFDVNQFKYSNRIEIVLILVIERRINELHQYNVMLQMNMVIGIWFFSND